MKLGIITYALAWSIGVPEYESKFLRTTITHPDIETVKKDLAVVLPEYECRGITIGVENHGPICMG
jgi:hypothetical protein